MDNNLPPMYRPAAPKGTVFNKRVIILIVFVLGIIIFWGIIAAFAPSGKNKNPGMEFNKTLQKDTKASLNTPDEINIIPDKYSEKNQPANVDPPAYPDLGPPTVPVWPQQSSNMDKDQPTSIDPNQQLLNQQERQMLQMRNDALKSPIRFSNLSGKQQSPQLLMQSGSNPTNPNIILPGEPASQDPNGQDEKRNFMNTGSIAPLYVNSALMRPISRFELKAGSFIPGAILTGIDSDLPGYITAQVRENVYDTVAGKFLLIPQGTKIIGMYDSKIAYAQKRLLVTWNRLLLPNGKSLTLEGMPGSDVSGYAGLKDHTDNHYLNLVSGALLTSIFGATAKVLSGPDTLAQSFSSLAISGGTKSLADAGTELFKKDLEIQPTIEIRPGMQFNVFVNKDLILENYQE